MLANTRVNLDSRINSNPFCSLLPFHHFLFYRFRFVPLLALIPMENEGVLPPELILEISSQLLPEKLDTNARLQV